MNRDQLLVGVLAIHLAAAIVHGSAHGLVPVPQPPWQTLLVLATVFVGPILGVALVRRGHPYGIELFTLSMAAGLVLGGLLHYLVENPDHIQAVPANRWRPLFEASAAGVGLTGALGTVAGLWDWYTRPSRT